MEVEEDGLLFSPDEVVAEIVMAPPPIVEMMVFPEESVVVITWPWLAEEEEGPSVVEAADVIWALVDSGKALELGGKELTPPGTDEVWRGGVTVVDGGSGVVVTVVLSRLASLAIFKIPVAKPGSSLWIASRAVRSSGNMPCLNFFGEKSCRAACREGGST